MIKIEVFFPAIATPEEAIKIANKIHKANWVCLGAARQKGGIRYYLFSR